MVEMFTSSNVEITSITFCQKLPVSIMPSTQRSEKAKVIIGRISPNHLLGLFDKNTCSHITPTVAINPMKNTISVIYFPSNFVLLYSEMSILAVSKSIFSLTARRLINTI